MKEKPVAQVRRSLLKAAVVCAGAVVAPAIAQQKPAQQGPGQQKPGLRIRTREEAGYRDEPYLGRTCSRCVLYQGDGKCVILSEPVSPNGWCTQWVPNTMG